MSNNLPRVLYGEANYRDLVLENGYYVDKTSYIQTLETYKCPVFLRPRRFGKSLFCTTLQYYYDVNFADQFDQLFSHTWIGKHPTPEHFYRTTFFFLCYQFLSHLYVWRMEHSYPGGRSNLEMEGKYHTPFARNHYLMEFKYISNASCDKDKIQIAKFQADPAHLNQLRDYYQDLCTQYPERNLRAYLIYCFGNRGFRMFEL